MSGEAPNDAEPMSAEAGPPTVKNNAWTSVQPSQQKTPRGAKFAEGTTGGDGPATRGPVKTGLAHKRRETQFQFPSVKRSKWVINPEKSRFMSKWDLVTMVALFFVAVGTPYEVCFLDTKFDILFGINFIVNIIFLIDMGLQFVLMYPTKSPYGRRMVSEPRLIVKNYLTSWFIIDFVSILPFDLLGLLYSDVAAFQALKSVKAVRLLRLLKLMRVLRASRVFKRWETRISINYSQLSLAKFLLIMIASGHWMACLWGLMGKATFDGKDGEHVEVWLERQKKSWLYDVFPPIEGEEHIPRTPDAGEIYVASLYWSVMTLTSIGYGDITPVTRSERLLCVVLMLIGAMVWAYIIGQACAVLANLDVHESRFKQRLDDLNYMLADRGIKHELRRRLRAFFFETKEIERVKSYKQLMTHLSPALQGEVARELNEVWVKKVWYLNKPDISEKLIVAAAQRIDMTIFAQGEIFGEKRTLYIVNRGLVGRRGRLLRVSCVWGEDFLLECDDLRDNAMGVALTYADMLYLHVDAMQQILHRFPAEKAVIRRYLIRVAVWRGFNLEALKRKREQAIARGEPLPKQSGLFAHEEGATYSAQGTATAMECSATETTRAYLLLERSELTMQAMQTKLDDQLVVLQRQQEVLERLLVDDRGGGGGTGSTMTHHAQRP